MRSLEFSDDGSITAESINALGCDDFAEWIFERLHGHDPAIAFDLSVHAWPPHVLLVDVYSILTKDAALAFTQATEAHLRQLIVGMRWTELAAQKELLKLAAAVFAERESCFSLISTFYKYAAQLLSNALRNTQSATDQDLGLLEASLEFLIACKWRCDTRHEGFWGNVSDLAVRRFELDRDEDRVKHLLVAVARGLARVSMQEMLAWLKTINKENVPRYQEYLEVAIFAEFLTFVQIKQGGNLLSQVLRETFSDVDRAKWTWISAMCRRLKVPLLLPLNSESTAAAVRRERTTIWSLPPNYASRPFNLPEHAVG